MNCGERGDKHQVIRNILVICATVLLGAGLVVAGILVLLGEEGAYWLWLKFGF